jgi:hypothetical protein
MFKILAAIGLALLVLGIFWSLLSGGSSSISPESIRY